MGRGRTFEPITTQAEFEKRLTERLRRQCDTHRDELTAYRAEHTASTQALGTKLLHAEARAIAAEIGYINPAAGVAASEVLAGLTFDPDQPIDLDLIRTRLTDFAASNTYYTHAWSPAR